MLTPTGNQTIGIDGFTRWRKTDGTDVRHETKIERVFQLEQSNVILHVARIEFFVNNYVGHFDIVLEFKIISIKYIKDAFKDKSCTDGIISAVVLKSQSPIRTKSSVNWNLRTQCATVKTNRAETMVAAQR